MAKRRCGVCKTSSGRKRSRLEPTYALGSYASKLGARGTFFHVSCLTRLAKQLDRRAQRRGLPREQLTWG